MSKTLPYLVTPGNIPKVLDRIKAASTPERVTQDFVQTKLQLPSSSGATMVPFLKKIGFVNSDGTPSAIYKKFRNASTAKAAAAEAIKYGYAPLYERNEFAHDLDDEGLRGLIIEEIGCEDDSRVLYLTVACFRYLKQYADFEATEEPEKSVPASPPSSVDQHQVALHSRHTARKVGMNLSYTINLNLPATSDISVFNAIFRSLKEHLLKDTDE